MDKKADDLTFGVPPTAYRREKTYDWQQIYSQLKERPGEWAMLEAQGKVSVHNSIRAGKISNFHPTMGVVSRTANTDLASRPRRAEIWISYDPHQDQSLTKKEADKIMAEARKKQQESKD